jgi:hypothetical protein
LCHRICLETQPADFVTDSTATLDSTHYP